MEKSSLRNHHNSLKDHSNVIKYSTDPAYCSWVSNKSNSNDQADSSEDLVGGFLWPPRSYTCTFCKREFRSAQALGGHMNVHRRDRARLRQIPSSQSFSASNYTLLNLNLHPNPNPNFSPFSSFSSPPPPTTTTTILPPLISSSPSSALCPTGGGNLTMMKSQIPASIGVCKLDGLSCKNDGTIVNKSEIVRLKLEIGLLGESRSDDLDLELRLSCS